MHPLGGLLLLMALGALLRVLPWRRGRRWGGTALLLSWAALWALSTPALSSRMLYVLESRYPPMAIESLPAADVIVVLGGFVRPPQGLRLQAELSGAGQRLLHAHRLFQAGKAPVILLSGGAIQWRGHEQSEALFMANILRDWGVPESAIHVEAGSRTTVENAINSGRWMRDHDVKRALLVTSALHMPRALAAFAKQQTQVIPVSADLLSDDVTQELLLIDFLPDAEALTNSSRALHEWLGLAWRAVRGGI
ncbi:hypothetical protein MAIT1_02500 [Magnetofaba australis IT-1]|uniref:DUF218 domain-containing protein n=1 Tax=Magnetofaba australis IT-1 TaxID=1434232 RepID=A0A1Y2K5U2_9PROT|nr:hypothetical protein MAIT1_02500 [Magnetofaba australis IT-1]